MSTLVDMRVFVHARARAGQDAETRAREYVDNRVYITIDDSIICRMNILKNRRNLIIAVLAATAAALLSYKYVPVLLQAPNDAAQGVADTNLAATREVSTIATYESPGGTDKVRFSIGLDAGGRVVSVRASDALKGDAVSENLAKFSTGLLLVIKGKKLSELSAVDRIGKSSLTTAAFNASLPALKAQP